MKELFQTIGAFLLVIAAMLGLSWIFMGNDFFLYKYFAPKQEAVRRQVFENTKSYNQGVQQDLIAYHHEWMTADADGKKAVEATVRQRFADYDQSKINDPEMVQWLNQCLNN